MDNKKKKLNIYIYFFIMLIAYFLFEKISQILPAFINYGIVYGKYGRYFISELTWLILIILIVYFTDNSKVLGEKKESFLKTILIALPLFLYSLAISISNYKHLFNSSINDIISLILYCGAIGIAEELLCRGWILNSFLTRYGDSRKNVILSIIFSALIFGGMHITNIWYGGQTIAETLIQILFAFSAGIYFGSLFYRTKNILAIAFLHAFYDFSLMVANLSLLRDCTSTDNVKILLYSLLVNILLSTILIVSGFVIIRKSKTSPSNEDVSQIQIEKDDKFKKIAIVISLVAFIAFNRFGPSLFNISENDFTNSEICYEYPKISLKNVEVIYNNYDNYDISENIKIYNEDKNLYVRLQKTKYLIAKEVLGFNVVENNDKYQVIYYVREDNSSDSVAYYSDYFKKDKIEETTDYVEHFLKSFIEYKMPAITSLGKIKDRQDNYYYVLLKDYNNNLFLIDNDNKIRLITIDKSKVSELEIVKIDRENEELSKQLLKYIPFINFKDNEYTDVYREVNSRVEELDAKVLYSMAFKRSKQEFPNVDLDLSICGEFTTCMGNAYVKEEELNNKLLTMYNKTPEVINNFAVANGFVEKSGNYYVFITNNNDVTIEKISKIINYKKEDNFFIIEEVAGFMYGNTISRYSDIDYSVLRVNDSKEELKNYFEQNQKEFTTFKHKFIYNEESNSYSYSETIIEKNS